jgi:hypothetical protein
VEQIRDWVSLRGSLEIPRVGEFPTNFTEPHLSHFKRICSAMFGADIRLETNGHHLRMRRCASVCEIRLILSRLGLVT